MKIESWLIYTLLAMFTWGIWAFLPKLSVKYINPKSAIVYEAIGGLLIGLIALLLIGFKVEKEPHGMLFAFLTGVTAIGGGLFFLYAVNQGKATVVIALTALYPLIGILLTFLFLHETITLKQGIGMALALFPFYS